MRSISYSPCRDEGHRQRDERVGEIGVSVSLAQHHVHHDGDRGQCGRQREPPQLLTLHTARPAEPQNQADRRDDHAHPEHQEGVVRNGIVLRISRKPAQPGGANGLSTDSPIMSSSRRGTNAELSVTTAVAAMATQSRASHARGRPLSQILQCHAARPMRATTGSPRRPRPGIRCDPPVRAQLASGAGLAAEGLA